MDYLIFAGWLLFLGWVLTRVPFVRAMGLPAGWILLLFGIKVAAGVGYGWFTHSDPSTDTWRYHTEGLLEYQLLFSNPGTYLRNLFDTGYADGYGGMLRAEGSYWNDLRANLMFKLVSVLHLFSGGRYYVNVVLYNFLVFFGYAALFRYFRQVFRIGQLPLLFLVFLLPSLLLYGSALHKEGLILALLGALCYQVEACWRNRQVHRLVLVLLFLLIIFLFRPYVVAALLPALAGCMLAGRFPALRPSAWYAAVYAAGILLFFLLPYCSAHLDLPRAVVEKQAAFLALGEARTSMPVAPLQPTATGFLTAFPQAAAAVFLRPWPMDVRMSALLMPHIAEWLLYTFLLIGRWRFPRRGGCRLPAFCLMGLVFAVGLCLMIGYTVPVLGAIIRYRALCLPFLLAPVLAGTDWKSGGRFFKIIK